VCLLSWDDPNDDPYDDDDSFDDNPFDDDRRKQLRKWLGDFLPDSVFDQIEEMMERMLRDLNQGGVFDRDALDEIMRNPQGTMPFMWGFQMRVGPDGKPIIQQFGNAQPHQGEVEPTRQLEPLVDVIEEGEDVVVVAELPGVEKDQIKVRVKGTTLTIDVDNPTRPYHKTIDLPTKVKKEESKSAIRNGVLEVRLKKA
jgi:HSP20 family protein